MRLSRELPRTSRGIVIFGVLAYTVLVIAFLLLNQGRLFSIVAPLGCVGGVMLGIRQRMKFDAKSRARKEH